jgi:hypothetical protein
MFQIGHHNISFLDKKHGKGVPFHTKGEPLLWKKGSVEMRRIRCSLVLFNIILVQVFPQTQEYNEFAATEEKHPFIAGAETLFANALFLGAINFTVDASWARPASESIRKNFSTSPIWEDTDGFIVNQIGHPYQGSLYFNAGRANGFNFYESMAFNLLGSVTWEMFCESITPSINDIITTTIAGAPVGEMLHRLYLEANAAGIPPPLSIFISPIDGLNRLVTGKTPPYKGGNLYGLSLFAGAGYARTDFIEKSDYRNLFSFSDPIGTIGIKTVYGNPFEQQSVIPFEHFEFELSLGGGHDYMDWRIISDGYLLSFSPISTESDTLSTGLSLHFDYVSLGELNIDDSTIDEASNALAWTVKHQHLFQNGFVLQSKLHAGFMFLGVTDYFSPDTSSPILKNYGAGLNIKLFFDIEKRELGKLSLGIVPYYLWTYPDTSEIASGEIFWMYVDIAYAYRISEHLSIGIADSFVMENSRFAGFPHTQKRSNTVKAFIKWDL